MLTAHRSQRFVSPDGRRGYLAIHRNASSSLGQYFKYSSGLGWLRGSANPRRPVIASFENCEEILVIVRDPFERWLSALSLMEKRGTAVENPLDFETLEDIHFASQSDFVAPYVGMPLVFVRLEDLNEWFSFKGLSAPANLNASDLSSKNRLRGVYDTESTRELVGSHYSDDYFLLEMAWQR